MLSERMLSKVVEACTANYLQLKPCDEAFMPSPNPGQYYSIDRKFQEMRLHLDVQIYMFALMAYIRSACTESYASVHMQMI